MIVLIVDRKSKDIRFCGEAKTTKDFKELNIKYSYSKYKRFMA